MNKVIFDKLAKSKFRSRFKLKEKEHNYIITKTIEIKINQLMFLLFL